MIDYKLLPDCVLSLEDESGGKERETMLLKRFAAAHDLPDPSTWQQPGKKPTQVTEEEGEDAEEVGMVQYALRIHCSYTMYMYIPVQR